MTGLISHALNVAHLSFLSIWQPSVLGVRAFLEDGQGKIVLVRHSYRSGWFLPGGGVHRYEAPERAASREAEEEAGLTSSAAPEFFGLYIQPVGLVRNVVAVYRLRDVVLDFRRNLEVLEMMWIDPMLPPAGTSQGTLRRLAELTGKMAKSSHW
jgi:8-oxo-dGTP pyrophosphatase MutT (NUDIX family)